MVRVAALEASLHNSRRVLPWIGGEYYLGWWASATLDGGRVLPWMVGEATLDGGRVLPWMGGEC